MTRYVVSDHHFTQDNVIRYCDRPFASVGEMHDVMLSRFHEAAMDVRERHQGRRRGE